MAGRRPEAGLATRTHVDSARSVAAEEDDALDGLMMDRPLLVKQIAERAETVFGHREVVARTQVGVERSTYGRVVEPSYTH